MNLSLIVLFILLTGCTYQTEHSLKGVCYVDSSTPFEEKLLIDARRISGNESIRVFTDCEELQELKSGKRNKLTTWGYNLSIKEAEKRNLEDLPLNRM